MKYLDYIHLPSYFQTKCVCFEFKYNYKIYHNFLYSFHEEFHVYLSMSCIS